MSDLIENEDRFKKGWVGGLPETPCGSGSKISNTKEQRGWIPDLINKYGIKSIADIGAGDLNWIKQIQLPDDVNYKPYDLVPRLPEVQKFNLIEQIPEKVDLIICLWVLNHLTFNDCHQAIENIKESGSRYLLMTDRLIYRAMQPDNIDMEHIEILMLNEKNDSIKLIDLNAL